MLNKFLFSVYSEISFRDLLKCYHKFTVNYIHFNKHWRNSSNIKKNHEIRICPAKQLKSKRVFLSQNVFLFFYFLILIHETKMNSKDRRNYKLKYQSSLLLHIFIFRANSTAWSQSISQQRQYLGRPLGPVKIENLVLQFSISMAIIVLTYQLWLVVVLPVQNMHEL